MKMTTKLKKGGYSTDIAKNYIDAKKPIYSLSIELEIQQRFENKQPTGEIGAYLAWFSQEGLPPFTVKFHEAVSLPTYLSIVELTDLQACEVGYNVYFKAKDLKVIR